MPDFSAVLQTYLDRLSDYRNRGASEDSIRDIFLYFLREAFPQLLSSTEPILLESHVPGIRVRGGFADVLYADLIFEFKRHLDESSRADGKKKLRDYILGQKEPKRFSGILTDGEVLEVYVLDRDQLVKVDELRLDLGKYQEIKLWLDCYLFHEKSIKPSAEDIVRRFGDPSPTFRQAMHFLQELWARIGAQPSVQAKFNQWQSLLAIVYGSSVGDSDLFLRHTYLALFARVLAFVAIQGRAPRSPELQKLIDGEIFEQMGFDNFVSGDFFTWATDAGPLAQALATRLTSSYDLAKIHEDLLKELYQKLVDPQTRHDLGEYYTPDWLAELTLREAGFVANPAPLLDPACGSGTFLFTAVRLLREAGITGKRLVQYAIDSLAGLDIHPLAVTIAKTNLVLALGQDLRSFETRIHIPVYMANALTTAEQRERAVRVPVNVDSLSRQAGKQKPMDLPSEFLLPEDLAGRPDAFSTAIHALLEFSNPALAETDSRIGLRARLLERGIPESTFWMWQSNLRLMRWLLREPATDTVWRFVLSNAYQPELLARRRFHFVAGNPPWLSYRFISRSDYQAHIRDLVFRYELLDKRETHLFTQIEMATLFFAFCIDRYLSDGGTIAFVMPRSILTGAKQHQTFQRRFVATTHRLIDCERVLPLFNVPSCVVIWSKQEEQGGTCDAIPTLRLEGQLPRKNMAFTEVAVYLHRTETCYQVLSSTRSSPYLRRVIDGATIYPRCFWFVRPSQITKVIDRERPQLETDDRIERWAKPPWKGISLSGSIEAQFLYATLLSDDLLPFGTRRFSLVALPVLQSKQQLSLLHPDDIIPMGKVGLNNWLRQAYQEWHQHHKQSEDLVDYLNWQNKLIRQRPSGVWKVLFNMGGTHVCSAVIDTTALTNNLLIYHLPVQGFIADYKTFWLETDNEEEAHYLCAILNAPVVDERIKPYQTKGAYGAQRGRGERDICRRPFEVIPIPLYDPGNSQHRHLAELSYHCHKKVADKLTQVDPNFLRRSVTQLRRIVREELLAEELAELDALVSQVCRL